MDHNRRFDFFIGITREKSFEKFFSKTILPEKLELVDNYPEVVWIQVCSKHDFRDKDGTAVGMWILTYGKEKKCFTIFFSKFIGWKVETCVESCSGSVNASLFKSWSQGVRNCHNWEGGCTKG